MCTGSKTLTDVADTCSGTTRFNIHKGSGTDGLPTAHTCCASFCSSIARSYPKLTASWSFTVNQLDLPMYDSYEKLRKQLLTAITEVRSRSSTASLQASETDSRRFYVHRERPGSHSHELETNRSSIPRFPAPSRRALLKLFHSGSPPCTLPLQMFISHPSRLQVLGILESETALDIGELATASARF